MSKDLAFRVREAYCREREVFEMKISPKPRGWRYHPGISWDGGVDRHGRKKSAIWPTLADRLQGAGIKDIEEYVRWVFAQSPLSTPPYPPALASAKYLKQFVETGAATYAREDIKRALEFQHRHFEQAVLIQQLAPYALGWSREAVYQSVLLDVSLPLSALFRYAVAKKLNLTRVMDVFREAARSQFQKYPDLYREIWSDLLSSQKQDVAC